MKLWEEAEECHLRAIETKEGDKQIELLDKAISLYLQTTKQAETEKIRLIRIGNARMVEANKYIALANKLASKAKASSRGVQVECIRGAASYGLSAYTSRKEAAEIAKEQGDVAAYHGRIGSTYSDQAVYHFYLAGASAVVSNWDEALHNFKKSLSLLENALKHYNRSLRIEFIQHAEDDRKQCLGYIENCRSDIQLAESMTTDIKTTGTPRLFVDVTADNLRQDTYSRVLLKIVNDGDGVAKDVKM